MASRYKSTFEERQAWLAEHPELRNAPRYLVIAALKKAGLVAPSTYSKDVRIYKKKGADQE